MYVPCILCNVLFRPRNAQYTSINNNICVVIYFHMCGCIYIIFRESLLIYAKLTESIKFTIKFT